MTNNLTIHAFPQQEGPAQRLADCLGAPCFPIFIHTFPDGESLVRVEQAFNTAIIYCSLAQPNEKLIALCLAAQALRDRGVQRVILVAPYMCYMRQDKAFEPGQAISQQVIGDMLDRRFDRILTIDPHLHRTKEIGAVFPKSQAEALSAAEPIADYILRQNPPSTSIVFGPDSEAMQWVAAVGRRTGMKALVGEKYRLDDRQVKIEIANPQIIQNRHVYLIDDICSSAGTIKIALSALLAAGAKSICAILVHALSEKSVVDDLMNAGLKMFISTDTVVNPSNRIEIAPLLADALKNET